MVAYHQYNIHTHTHTHTHTNVYLAQYNILELMTIVCKEKGGGGGGGGVVEKEGWGILISH